jgi:hypothetical protein
MVVFLWILISVLFLLSIVGVFVWDCCPGRRPGLGVLDFHDCLNRIALSGRYPL